MSTTSAKFHWIICAMVLLKEIQADSLTLDTQIRDTCSRSLSNLVFQICTGGLVISDLPEESMSRVRGKRAAIFFAKERTKRQIADECCLHPCTVSQIVQYCPETW